MTKWRSIPSALPSRRRMRTAMAWKVPIQMAPAVRFRRCSTRPRISRAALLVNVTARISPGSARPCWMSQAIRWVKTRVLPLPAPAKINSGPSSAVTAARCGGFSPASKSTARSAAAGVVDAKAKASLPGAVTRKPNRADASSSGPSRTRPKSRRPRQRVQAAYDADPNSRESAARPAGSLVAAAAAAHPAGGHVVHVVVVIGARPVGRLQRLREGAEELVTPLHSRDPERVFEGPVIIGRVLAFAGPQEKRDELHLDGRLEFGVALGSALGAGRGVALALALSLNGRDRERRNCALGRANAPCGAGGRWADRRRLSH